MSDQPTPTPTPEPTPTPTPASPDATIAPQLAATPGGGSPFNSGKQKTIAMIVAGVVVVGGIGGIVGAMAGGGDDKQEVAAPGEGGSGILNPTPIPNTSPAPEVTPSEPTPQPTDALPPSPPPTGDGVTLGGIATIPLPSGWSVLGQGDADALLTDDQSTWVYGIVGQEDPSTDAGALLSQVVSKVLPSENYSQLQLGSVSPIQPFGSMVSAAVVDYQALWVDSQGSMPLYGQMYVGVRQDGATLILTAEHTPPEEFDQSYESWGPVVDGAFQSFASL